MRAELKPGSEELAQFLYEIYARLAWSPKWENLSANKKRLMIACVSELIKSLRG